jgi:6,7-dimethyl-8-ribityllumazine synthase
MRDHGPVRILEGHLVCPPEARFAVVASRFNDTIVERLLDGALDGLVRHGARAENVSVVRVPGAWETPLICRRLAKSGQFEAVIALGCVIRGATAHYDHVAGAAAQGVAAAALETGVPVVFGILTTDNIEQALERSGTKAGNKGFDAAMAAVELVTLARTLKDAGL